MSGIARASQVELAAALLRIGLGGMWLAHGCLKLTVFTVPGLATWLAGQGLPSALAWPLTLAELLGGAALLLGIQGRWVSLALSPILLGAIAVHGDNGWVHTSAGGGWEYPAFLLLASVVHVLLGDGAWALRGRLPQTAS